MATPQSATAAAAAAAATTSALQVLPDLFFQKLNSVYTSCFLTTICTPAVAPDFDGGRHHGQCPVGMTHFFLYFSIQFEYFDVFVRV
jgi:hypothetical protein